MPSFDPGVLERLDKLKGEWDALHDVISVQLNLFHHYKQNSSRKLPELPAELIGDGGNPECDVMAAELQFESIKASLPQFELIVVAMQECILKYKLKVAELGMDQAVDRGQFGCALSRVDYLMMAANVCAMFENEYVFKVCATVVPNRYIKPFTFKMRNNMDY
jgi:hypothetical protein